MDYVIIVNDNGELKTISATEIDALRQPGSYPDLTTDLDNAINEVLDARYLEAERAAKKAARK